MPRTFRILSIALALLGASAFAMAVEGGHWWTLDEVSVGPVSTMQCFGGTCAQTGFDWIGPPGSWVRWGAAAYAAGLVAALVLVTLAASLASKRNGRLAARVSVIAAGTAVAAGGLFIYTFPSLPGMVMDRGIWLYGGGVALAAAAALVALRGARRFTA
ncbi:MAG: hypothetical protein K8W52_47345 [Deltaproteobacteria bacterium]|nr:hypothetical protein [Deltaproteobacteria bacterium]